jgi:hypothetical protein
MRGGSCNFLAEACRSANRHFWPPDARAGDLGFRVCVIGDSLPAGSRRVEKERQELRAFLVGTRWHWSVGDLVYNFRDGVSWISDHPNSMEQWRAVSGNTVEITAPDSTKSEVTFNSDRTRFLWVYSNGDIRNGTLIAK